MIDITKIDPNKHSVMDESFVSPPHQWTFYKKQSTFHKNLNLQGKYCHHPFNTITVDGEGDVYLCICQAWLPISVGKIWEFHSFESLISSPRAREIQSSILDGSYRYCDHNSCSLLNQDNLSTTLSDKVATVNWINFAVDNSCNLTCPSCRVNFQFVSDGPEFEKRIKIVNHLIYLIEQHYYPLKFSISGDGDAFASLIYRHFLSNLKIDNYKSKSKTPYFVELDQQIEIELITNGILLKSHWHKLSKIYENIVRIKISFDAGTESIYKIVRTGGEWNKLIESCQFIAEWKQKNNSNMILSANFVVQTKNYLDMPAYVELCDALGFDEINFQKITDWGTFSNFAEQAVWQNAHLRHQEFLDVLKHPSLNNKKVNFTNLL